MTKNEFAPRRNRRGHVDRTRAAKRCAYTLLLLAAAAGEALAQGCITPPEGMISWWPGDGNAADIVNGNDGILEGGADYGIGLVAEAFDLDGSDGFVTIPSSPDLNFGTNDFTVDFWVKLRDVSRPQVLIEKWIQEMGATPLGTGWTLSIIGSSITYLQGDVSNETGVSMYPPDIVSNTWIHVALVRAAQDIRIYWNGVSLGGFAAVLTNLSTDASLKLGHRCNSVDTPGCEDERGWYLDGLIDEVEVFGRALNPSEIEAIYTAGSCGKVKPPSQSRVDIDVKPHVAHNGINLRSKGSLRVAIHGSAVFDALQVDPVSVRLGPGEAIPYRHAVTDYNRDGYQDLGVIFRIQDLGLCCSDTAVTLTGETYAGTSVSGSDAVEPWNCCRKRDGRGCK